MVRMFLSRLKNVQITARTKQEIAFANIQGILNLWSNYFFNSLNGNNNGMSREDYEFPTKTPAVAG